MAYPSFPTKESVYVDSTVFEQTFYVFYRLFTHL
jgi:hypothetical protein